MANSTLAFLSRFLRGGDKQAAAHARVSRAYLTALGLVYLTAFGSIALQWRGLIGSHGISPVAEKLAALPHWTGFEKLFLLPTLAWLAPGDGMVAFLCWGGCALSLLLVAGVYPRLVAFLLWAFYLSLSNIGDIFLQYQWESLLLEAGFLAPFVAPPGLRPRWNEHEPPALFLWLHRWLLFRLLFASGMAKILSGDPTWHALTALQYHYETQPLPTPLAWYAHQLPAICQKASALFMFFAEILVPFLFFLPRPFRRFAFVVEVALQLTILLTGNYGYFNWLTIALCLFLLDDRDLRAPASGPATGSEPRGRAGWAIQVTGVLVLLAGMGTVGFRGGSPPFPLATLVQLATNFRIISTYGLFAVMTTKRNEIAIEGSQDKKEWREYVFRWKSGDPKRAPAFMAPHLPRLDWQAWFAALGSFEGEDWLQRLLLRLLQGERDVIAFFANDPFPGAPPKYVRVLFFRYHFSDSATWQKEKVWWTRERLADYSPVLSLKGTAVP